MQEPADQDRRKYLRIAIEEAKLGVRERRGGPFGAVVVKDGSVIAQAANGVVVGLDPTAHAEVQALRLACQGLQSFSLAGCDVYASCEPCPMCLFALCWARPRGVYYAATRMDAASVGFDDERLYAVCTLQLEELPFHYQRVLVETAEEPFVEYARLEGRVPY